MFARSEFEAALADRATVVVPQPDSRFNSDSARRRLEAAYGIRAIDALGTFSRAEIAACGALVEYVELTQKGRLPRLETPRRQHAGEALELFKEGAPGDAHLFADRLKIELGDGQGSVEVEDDRFRRRRWVATRLPRTQLSWVELDALLTSPRPNCSRSPLSRAVSRSWE